MNELPNNRYVLYAFGVGLLMGVLCILRSPLQMAIIKGAPNGAVKEILQWFFWCADIRP